MLAACGVGNKNRYRSFCAGVIFQWPIKPGLELLGATGAVKRGLSDLVFSIVESHYKESQQRARKKNKNI